MFLFLESEPQRKEDRLGRRMGWGGVPLCVCRCVFQAAGLGIEASEGIGGAGDSASDCQRQGSVCRGGAVLCRQHVGSPLQ